MSRVERYDVTYVNCVEPLPIPGGRRFYELHRRMAKQYKILYLQPYYSKKERQYVRQMLNSCNISVRFLRIPFNYSNSKFEFYLFRTYVIPRVLKELKKLSKFSVIIHEEASPLPLFSKIFLGNENPTLLTLHEIRHVFSFKVHGILGTLEFVAEKLVSKLNCYDSIIAVSSSTQKLAFKLLKIKTLLVPNGVDTNKFKPLKEISKDSNTIRIVTVGRLVRHKGFNLLPYIKKALSKITDQIGNLKIVVTIIGHGPLQKEIGGFCKKNSNSRIKFNLLSRVPERKYVKILQHSDIYLHLNQYMEGFGFSVAEAMSCGLPVIAFKIPGVKDLVKDGENGFLVPIGDFKALEKCLEFLILNENIRRKMGKNARKRIEKYFSIEKAVNLLERVYKQYL